MFKIKHEDGNARAGTLFTPHGKIETPAFLPVATKGCVKTIDSEELAETGTQAIISNSFLLYLEPGVKVIKKAGGIHRLIGWNKGIFTDSGGYQILKKDFLVKISDRGVTFRSPFDSSRHFLTPELSMEIQNSLSADVAMALDDCPPYGTGYKRAEESARRTLEWAERCKSANRKQALFAIAQGGHFESLRRENAEELVKLGFDGYAIGGLSIGEPKKVMFEVISKTASCLPEEKPRYLMGLGSPKDVLEAISAGIDMFDSAFPTRNARHSTVYTRKGRYNVSKGKFASDLKPLDEECECYTCRTYSRAYVSHLLKVYEVLGMKLVTTHNLSFMQRLMSEAREAIAKNEFSTFKNYLRG